MIKPRRPFPRTSDFCTVCGRSMRDAHGLCAIWLGLAGPMCMKCYNTQKEKPIGYSSQETSSVAVSDHAAPSGGYVPAMGPTARR